MIVIINVCFSYLPSVHFGLNQVSAGDFLVGWIYIVRDFAQREVGHKVLIAMAIGIIISFWLADPVIAKASVAAFAVGEAIDWLIFTFTGKPLSQRLLWSAGISAPIDTYIFLQLAHHLNWLEFCVMAVVKCFGVVTLWWYWKIRNRDNVTNRPVFDTL
ncbi:MAG: hypothetical protein JSR33_04860 [Proteobacteria bacterium]|nr:hypothetical protein [Pseudomonadota bacterium]